MAHMVYPWMVCAPGSCFISGFQKPEKVMTDPCFIYLILKDKMVLCDPEYCQASPKAFDISVYELATYRELLGSLGLMDFMAERPNAVSAFIHYLSAFGSQNEEKERKLKANPTLRILTLSDALTSGITDLLYKDRKLYFSID
jgi:hypothetical protein